MKRILSLSLAVLLCLSLCACGKSKEAKAVDDLILSIGEVTAESAETVQAAAEAYNALSEKDRESIENYETLKKAQEDLFYIEFYDLSNRLLEVYYNCKQVSNGTRIIWDNVGSQEFWTSYNAVRILNQDLSKAEYDELHMKISGAKAYATIWCAARGLCPSNVYDVNKMTDDGQEKTIDLCVDFNNCYTLISENMDPIAEDVRILKNAYQDNFQDEVNTLNELCIEVSMYADFALEPSGSLSSYTSTEKDYQNSIDRMIKLIDSYR